jgi:hypothetical protein
MEQDIRNQTFFSDILCVVNKNNRLRQCRDAKKGGPTFFKILFFFLFAQM